MAKEAVAILGGGIAGLTAAHHLSRTPALRDRYDVTVYQMGWRVGGKLASGRDALGRNLEHGLHVWFGCYENAFQLLQEVYAARTPEPGSPFQVWTDAIKPQSFTPIGVQTEAGWTFVPVEWPTNDGVPGDGKLFPTPWEIVTELLSLVRIMIRRLEQSGLVSDVEPPAQSVLDMFGLALRAATHLDAAAIRSVVATTNTTTSPGALATAAMHWATSLGGDPLRLGSEHLTGIVAMLDSATPGLREQAGDLSAEQRLMLDTIDVFQAALSGIVEDLVLPGERLMSLDDMDFREWLLQHGADPAVVGTSSIIRMIYDTAFLYEDGDPARPNGAAGAVLGGCMRLVGTYKGAMLWLVQGGMGECVLAPLYQTLIGAGVQFRFFHKVIGLDLTQDGTAIGAIRLAEQADVITPPYRPTFVQNGITCWPAQPDWQQLHDGPAMQARGVDFESPWCQEQPVRTRTLEVGRDFDRVVLAIALGAYKELNADGSFCQALIDRHPGFADYVRNSSIVPNLSLQLWTTATTAQLGWTQGKPAAVAGPEPLNIWADMSQVAAVEGWAAGLAPKGVHYLAGTYATTLYKQRASESQTQSKASAEVRDVAKTFLTTQARAIWPLASNGDDFDWTVLVAPEGQQGEQRLDAQYWRANISPTECTVGSPKGSTKFRLAADESGFTNLVLAGEATLQGFNASCVEAAVMSGMAAARAIAGEPRTIIGYDFMTRPLTAFLL